MLTFILIALGLLLVVALGAFIFLRNKSKAKEPLTVRHAVSAAKAALQDKEQLPAMFRRMKDKTEIPFNAMQENKAKAEIQGTYHLRWDKLQVGYVFKDAGEKIVIQLNEHPEVVTLFYHDGTLNGVNRGKESLDAEDFEMRHAGTISEQLRSFVRYHLRFPGGSLKVDKAAEPTFKPVRDLKKSGEIHLKGPKPPGKLPKFEDE